jgi:phage terminase large subunit
VIRLVLLMVALLAPDPVDRFILTAQAAGCPDDQLRNLLRADIVFQPAQFAFAAAARLCDALDGPTEIGFGGARMGGKSHAVLSQVGADDCVRHPGLKCLMLRKVGTSGRESFEALLPKTIGRLGTYVPSQSLFKLTNGSWIKLGHFQNESDIDKYLGLEYDVIAIEEATTLSHTKKQAVQSCCRSPEGSGWRARMYLSTNPGGVGHSWFKKLFVEPYRQGAETRTRFVPATVDDNAFATSEYREFLEGLTGWLKRAWRYGDWDIAAGQFFTTFRRAEHVIAPFGPGSPLPPHWRAWLGLDYGFTHYTVAHLLAEDGDGNVYVVDEHAERGWLPERHATAIRGMLGRHGVEVGRLRTIVAGHDVFNKDRRGTCIADDYAEHGLRLKRADVDRVNGAGEILRRLGDVDADIRPSLFISESCARLIECLPALEHDPHRPEDVLKVDCDPESGLGGDDAYDSARYGIMHVAKKRGVFTANHPSGDGRV